MSSYFSNSAQTKIIEGQSFFASKTLLPVFTPYFLASFDAAIIQLLPFALTIPTGFLRRPGLACWAAVAKKLSRSTCRITRSRDLALSLQVSMSSSGDYIQVHRRHCYLCKLSC